MKKIGLIINPVAGMGGSVGLKGTDHVVEEALRRGAVPGSEKRAETALRELLPYKDELLICTGAGHMGGELAQRMGFRTEVLPAGTDTGAADAPVDTAVSADLKTPADADIPADLKTPVDTDIPAASAFCFATAGSDTIALGKRLLNEQADLLLFAGGDGTARDIYQAVGTELVCVGIPAGVKIHSPVYAKNPGAAGKLAAMWMSGRIKRYEEKEVLDIDEDAYRSGHINTALYGYLKIPAERALTQNRKAPTPLSDEAAIESIAYEVTDHMEPDVVYLVGAGTTTRGVMKKLGLPNTLIGVDVVENGKVLENDAYGERILSHIRGKRAKLILTVTGGQGFLFGRGNQQLTPEVIRTVGKENLIILATSSKLAELRGNPLLVDTGDDALNEELCGYYRVITGYKEYTVCRVAAG